MGAIRYLSKRLLTACASRERFLVRGPKSQGGRPRIAITFDDGPHPEHTSRLLDLLDELKLRATFFVIGRCADEFPQIVTRQSESGHEVDNHTYTHSEPKRTSSQLFLDEVARTDDVIRRLTGNVPSVVRPPKGEFSWQKLWGLWQAKKTVALWTVDPKDFAMTTEAEMARWCGSYEPQDGDVLLLHDNGPLAGYAIQTLAARGIFERFETVTVQQFLR